MPDSPLVARYARDGIWIDRPRLGIGGAVVPKPRLDIQTNMRDIEDVLIGAPVLFAVVSPVANPLLGLRIVASFPDNHFIVSGHHWLIVANGMTSQEIATTLGLGDGTTGTGIVYATANYWGRANPQIWEWIRAKMSAPPNA
jgi:hypothetical protein